MTIEHEQSERTAPAKLALMLVLGIATGLAAAEGIARWALPFRNWTPSAPFSTSALVKIPGGSFKTKPNFDGELLFAWQKPVRVRTDENGWRIPGPEYPRPAKGKIAFFVGASYTWGFGVLAEEAWPWIMEARLKDSKAPIRVVNAAQMGHTLPQMLTILEAIPDADLPDCVFVCLPAGGLYMLGVGSEAETSRLQNTAGGLANLNLALDRSGDALDEVNGWVLRADRFPKSPVTDWLQTRSAIGHRVVRRMAGVVRPERIVKADQPIDVLGIEKACAAVGRRFAACYARFKKKKIPFTVVFEPIDDTGNEQVARSFDENTMRWFLAFARESGLAAKDPKLLDLVRAEGNPDHLPLDKSIGGDFNEPFDRHYSAKGHRKVGEKVASWFLTNVSGKLR